MATIHREAFVVRARDGGLARILLFCYACQTDQFHAPRPS